MNTTETNKTFDGMTDETMTIAEEMQRDCHQIVAAIMADDPKVSYTDATLVFIFNKLAQLQWQINQPSETHIQ